MGRSALDRGAAMTLDEGMELAMARTPSAVSPRYCEVHVHGFVAVALMSVTYEDSKTLVGLSVGRDGKPVVTPQSGHRISLLRFSKSNLDRVTPCELSRITGRLENAG